MSKRTTITKDIEAITNTIFDTHIATLVQNTDTHLIIDWRRADGGKSHYINYILDKKNGNLHISGDTGSCIASWGNQLTPHKLYNLIQDPRYFIEKIKCSTDKYSYTPETIVDDIKYFLNENFIQSFLTDNEYGIRTIDDLWTIIKTETERSTTGQAFIPTELLRNIIEDIDIDCLKWIYHCGERIHIRIHLWCIGYKMAYDMLNLQA